MLEPLKTVLEGAYGGLGGTRPYTPTQAISTILHYQATIHYTTLSYYFTLHYTIIITYTSIHYQTTLKYT